MTQYPPGSVVVSGASAGVGRAIACEFARHGWNVGLIARGRNGLEGARAEVERLGGRALVLQADVSDAKAVEDAASVFVRTCGSIDVWVNSAMVTILAPVRETEPEEFRRVTEVTYLGQVHGTMAALRRMSLQGHGTILSIGSALAYRGIPLQAPYCGAKFAIRGFLDSLRSELIHEGSPIRITEVHLPAVNTPQFDWARNKMAHRPQPVPPVVQPEAIGRQVYTAALRGPREVWLGGSSLQVILGDAAAPSVMDRFLASKAYSGQQTDAEALTRPDNLFAPMDQDADHGTRGRFGDIASPRVSAVNPAWLRGAALVAGAAVAGGLAWSLFGADQARRRR